jgi:hypothetical protein
MTALGVQEIREYTRTHPDLSGDRAYNVDCNGTDFGLLYVTGTACTLAWEGIISFEGLEDEVGKVLRTIWAQSVNLQDAVWRQRTLVALVFSSRSPSSDDDLVKYWLGKPEDLLLYRDAMKRTDEISFARFDFSDSGRSNPFFSFIAQNAAFGGPSSENELAVKLPKSITEGLLSWAIFHHRNSDRFSKEVDVTASVAALNKVL